MKKLFIKILETEKGYKCYIALKRLVTIIKNQFIPYGSIVFVHVGKCGGRTVKNQFPGLRSIHMVRPPFRRDLKYIIIVRDPIARAKSIWKARNIELTKDLQQQKKHKSEFNILLDWKYLDEIACCLCLKSAQRDIIKIHHMAKGHAYYLKKLLNKCSPKQIKAVLTQENLDRDIEKVFGIKNAFREHYTGSKKGDLSELAIRNLRIFFAQDYEVLTKLWCWGKIDKSYLHNGHDS